ncbi:hypothetical protein CAPTEDRAFT_220459 [Capitella teleta]|uniref:BTB domain-containing protein n=1 Tax=Capitella teleta TaxID=283909 RepID=R7TD98_CAPTE|nr:hypothetical protein CAPTEDRAFT_220459 [Capitella teleta]|eukprot:ELT89041.1 hypothetical protein CAPTEDRAFT_220459 [Capitella teleta]
MAEQDTISAIRAAHAAITDIYQLPGGDEKLLEFYTDDALIIAPSFDTPVTKREHLKDFAKKRRTLGLVKATTEEYEIEEMSDSCAYSATGVKFMNAQDCIMIQIKQCDDFHRMFLTDMTEKAPAEAVIKDINVSTGGMLLEYSYTSHIELTSQNAQDLLAASEMFLLGNLKQNIEEFLYGHTETTNCISHLNLARMYDLKTSQKTRGDI